MTSAPGAGVGLAPAGASAAVVLGRDDAPDRQAVGRGEGEVALVVAGHGHDRAGAVVHQHVVGHPDRDLLAVDRVDDVAAGEDAGLAGRSSPRSAAEARAAAAAYSRTAASSGRPSHQVPTSGCSGARTKKVAPKSVSGRVVKTGISCRAVLGAEDHPRALGAADPVALHGEHALGPVDQLVHVVQQALGVVGDAEEPLGQLAQLHHGAAALAAAVDDLLVGQHGLVHGAPVDRRLAPLGQAALEEAQEEPLGPAVVLGLAGGDLGVPVDGRRPGA